MSALIEGSDYRAVQDRLSLWHRQAARAHLPLVIMKLSKWQVEIELRSQTRGWLQGMEFASPDIVFKPAVPRPTSYLADYYLHTIFRFQLIA